MDRRPKPVQPAGGRRYVVVCRGPHCRERGSLPLRRRLVGLLRGWEDVGLLGYNCFGLCDEGPNVAFYPEGAWYGGLHQPEDADRVVRHALGADLMDAAPLAVPEVDRQEHLRNLAELVATEERDRARRARRRWWWPF